MTTETPNYAAGIALLAGMARTGRPFDCNEIRDRLRNLGFGRFTSGRLLQMAESDGLIRQCGVERSTDPRTRGAFVRKWIGVTESTESQQFIPVRRDRGGRFRKSQQAAATAPLLDLLQEA